LHIDKPRSETSASAESPAYSKADPQALVGVAAGIDVRKESLVCTVIRLDGSYDTKTFRNFKSDISELGAWLLQESVEKASIKNTGVYWEAPFYILSEAGIDVMLVRAYQVNNIPGRKTDTLESFWLAKLTRAGLLTPSRVISKDLNELREYSRIRKRTNDEMNSVKSRIRNLLVKGGFGVDQVVSSFVGRSWRIMIAGLINKYSPEEILNDLADADDFRLTAPKEKVLDALQGEMSDTLRLQICMLLDRLDELVENAEKLDVQIEEDLRARGEDRKIDLLQTIPGVSRSAAMAILLELGVDVSEFSSGQALARWAGMCPGDNKSAGKAMRGNIYLRSVLFETANAAVTTDSVFKKKFGDIKDRLGHNRALMTIGHKLLRVIYGVLTKGKPYEDHAVHHE
jgi:transposase